ncbi:MAG TPA: PilW family protein [Steroidobacteraceae bacterium]|nr:PilW family protein [Steroidobacteraceae bacterium]
MSPQALGTPVSRPRAGHRIAREGGYSLIELSVAILIALFLLGGVLLVEQDVHTAYGDQSGLAQLQDEERFAMSLLTAIIQSGGHFPNPWQNTIDSALPALTSSTPQGQSIPFQQEQAIWGVHNAGAPYDSIAVRFMTTAQENMTLCDGTTGAGNTYTNYFYVATASGNSYLDCELQTGTTWAPSPVQLVKGLQKINVLYGINTTGTDNNVDSYLRADQMTAAQWLNVTSVKVTLTFVNPLANETGQPGTVQFTRVISLMSRIGVAP